VRHAPRRALPAPRQDWAYFIDIDGTLLDLAESPRGVRPDPHARALVAALHRNTGGAVALISGRAIPDIDALFGDERLPVAGQHGTERRDAAGRIIRHAAPAADLEGAAERLAAAIAERAGLLLERKGLSLALHYRRAPRLAAYAHRLVRSELSALGDGYCMQTGKRVVELKPAGKDKGGAVAEFMGEAPFQGRSPVFLGDDVTDEYGFVMVNHLSGYSVKVGAGRTAARWRLRDVRAVRAWLERVAAA
jgi:trehalose 6-phosphate phosphatase